MPPTARVINSFIFLHVSGNSIWQSGNLAIWKCKMQWTIKQGEDVMKRTLFAEQPPFARPPHISWWNTLLKTSFSPQNPFAYICRAAFSGVPVSWRVLSYTWVDRVSQLSRESREGRDSDLQLAWDWQPRNVQLYMCGSLGRRTDSGWISQLQLCQTYPVWRENSQILYITNSEKKKKAKLPGSMVDFLGRCISLKEK